MRAVLSISIPKKKKTEIVGRAKKAKMSVSAFVVNSLDLENEFISDTELLKMGEDALIEYSKGKSIEVDSLAELVK